MSTTAAGIAHRDRSVLVLVDVQEKLFPLMQEKEVLEHRLRMLLRGAALLGVPILVTEQYKKGLGGTIAGLLDEVSATVVEKASFSCFGCEDFVEALRATEREQLVVCGIEAHICVMQTCLDGRREGYDVFCVEDAVSSRLAHARDLGVARMRAGGTASATAEGVLFEWLGRCDDDHFKAVLPLVREAR